jgi:(4-alkanoyl-5-oxo-2,5-dihydrofuran-3-yl)methyl phosphate reductase
MTYLITGASGNIGSRVVERLLERGERPRVFVRDPVRARARFGDRVDIVVGDLSDPASLAPALQGVDALFLVNTGPELAARDEAAAIAAKSAGVGRLVKLSSMDAQQGLAIGAWHACGEAAIRGSGLAFTFIEPTGFMSNALLWARSVRAEGVVRASTGEGRIAFIHPEDIAAVSTMALTTREYVGQTLAITGPEALSYGEATGLIGAAIGKTLRFEAITDEQIRRRMIGTGMPEAETEAHVALWCAVREGRLCTVTDTVERVLGRKPIAFAQWAKENAAAFC